ncbi:unnamed protein product [Nippostrongylus brasiliensis]|uniref:Secreted protein n=1 Tax=Nippostrongylus brasiliensis TaxID=27835 RepID=A0A158QZK5_NIPBR|nr:unnamed protein product [Nippostrongylus brasiliensis]
MVSKLLVASICVLSVALALPQSEEAKSGKRRQYIQPLAGAAQVPRNIQLAAPAVPVAVAAAPPMVAAAPAVPVAFQPVPAVAPTGQCPGGPSLPIECDPKRPWPQCPPQSYCYATNSVDVGPYFCCPIWSTYGAAWRPATPFYNYVPPMPANWPDVAKITANWPAAAIGLPVKARKPAATQDDTEEEDKIESSINQWVDRQAKLISDSAQASFKYCPKALNGDGTMRSTAIVFLPLALMLAGVICAADYPHRSFCPDGAISTTIDCDPKRPWPRCPPQTYCYATNSVDVGPYFCCPSSTNGTNLANQTPSSIFGVGSTEATRPFYFVTTAPPSINAVVPSPIEQLGHPLQCEAGPLVIQDSTS